MSDNTVIPGFTRDMLKDFEIHEAYLAPLGIAPDGDDDTVFGVPFIYCSSHRRGHSAGWCTVRNVNKVPLESTEAALVSDECRKLGYSLYEDDAK